MSTKDLSVKIIPKNKTIKVKKGESLLMACQREGIFVKSSCGGHASCGECVVRIIEDKSKILPEISFEESKLLGNVFHITKERLSCQIFHSLENNQEEDLIIDVSAHEEKLSEYQRTNSLVFAKKVPKETKTPMERHSENFRQGQGSDRQGPDRRREDDQDRDHPKRYQGGNRRPQKRRPL